MTNIKGNDALKFACYFDIFGVEFEKFNKTPCDDFSNHLNYHSLFEAFFKLFYCK